MPAFLVELPENRRVQGVNALSVFAADAPGARVAAQMQFGGDANDLWATVASVTEVVVGLLLADAGPGWSMFCRISGAAAQTAGFDPFIVEADGLTRDQALGQLGANRFHMNETVVVDGGGTGYSDDDILTLVGGTAVRAATYRVTGETAGVIDTVEMVDPGEYTELPSPLTALAVTDSGNSDATLDVTQAAVGSYEAIMAQMVTGLLSSPDIDDAGVDFSEAALGARLLTVSSIADNIGDATLEFECRQNGVAFAPLVSTLTDEGIAGAVLTVAIPASPLVPPRVDRFDRKARTTA